MTGDGNILTANRVELQGSDGILVNGDGNILGDNSSNRNRGVGIKVVGDGNPNASTGNRVSLNNESPQCEILRGHDLADLRGEAVVSTGA